MLSDQVVSVGGRQAVALHEQMALAIQQRQLRVGTLGVDLRDQQLVGGRVDLKEVQTARGDGAGRHVTGEGLGPGEFLGRGDDRRT